ncbi:MAG: hypothetical protein J2O48_09050 [Solirubrobacterales bacterium]|nr:hypothetical protein [Solirubrobacterales bacterium]
MKRVIAVIGLLVLVALLPGTATAASRNCAVPKGSRLLKKNSSVVLTTRPDAKHKNTLIYGCERANGKQHQLASVASAGSPPDGSIQASAVGGRYAALAISHIYQPTGTRDEDDTAGPCNVWVSTFDLRSAKRTLHSFQPGCTPVPNDPSRSGAGPAHPSITVSQLQIDAAGVAAWRLAGQDDEASGTEAGEALIGGGVGCSASACAAVGSSSIVSSSTPTAGGWHVKRLGAGANLGDVSCTTGLCAVIGTAIDPGSGSSASHPVVYTATGPDGSWKATDLGGPAEIGGGPISCPSKGFCAAVTGGWLWTSSHPTGGAKAWHRSRPVGTGLLPDIDCPSAGRCLLLTQAGSLLASSNPGGGQRAWQKLLRTNDIGSGGHEISCPNAGFCAVLGGSGNLNKPPLYSSSDPFKAGSWQPVAASQFANQDPDDLLCASGSTCLATDADPTMPQLQGNNANTAFLWTTTTGPNGNWQQESLDKRYSPAAEMGPFACMNANACVAESHGSASQMLSSTDPGGGSKTWQPSPPVQGLCTSSTCTADEVYASHGNQFHTLDVSQPATSPPVNGVKLNGHSVSWTDSGKSHTARVN